MACDILCRLHNGNGGRGKNLQRKCVICQFFPNIPSLHNTVVVRSFLLRTWGFLETAYFRSGKRVQVNNGTRSALNHFMLLCAVPRLLKNVQGDSRGVRASLLGPGMAFAINFHSNGTTCVASASSSTVPESYYLSCPPPGLQETIQEIQVLSDITISTSCSRPSNYEKS